MPDEIVCSPAELDVAGEAADLDVRRFPFTIAYHGSTVTERVNLAKSVHRDLAARGLVEGSRFTPEFTETLRLFARAPLTIALAGSAPGRHLAALAAFERRSALLAVQTGEDISLRRCSAQVALRGLVALPPDLPPGPGEPVTVTEPPEPDEEEDFSQFRVTRRLPLSPTAESLVAQVLGRPRTGAGYFVAGARDRRGREEPRGSLSYLDTDVGRYAVVPGTGPRGEASATYRPWDRGYAETYLSRIVDTYE